MADPRFFKNTGPYTLGELAIDTGAKLYQARDTEKTIRDIAPLHKAETQHISFLDNPKYLNDLKTTQAGACVIRPEHAKNAPEHVALLLTDNPYYIYAQLAKKFYPALASSHPSPSHTVALNATIDESADIEQGCAIEHNVVIGPNVSIASGCRIRAGVVINEGVIIGKNCTINSNVTISNAIIGEHVIIHQGSNIGQDGFGYAFHEGNHFKVPQLGRVIIEDCVEIGAGTCIDRGSGPDTVVGTGTKIDNLVQIAHNVQIGKHCILVSQVGIAGSTKVGDYTVLGGQVGIAGHLNIGSQVQAAAQSGITKNIKDGETVCGMPAIPIKQHHRQVAMLKKLAKKK